MTPNNLMCHTYYKLKTRMLTFGLSYKTVDAYIKGCMLYWKDDIAYNAELVCKSVR